jgi:DNA-directed RNA polymerase subunit RPC12/RpoP
MSGQSRCAQCGKNYEISIDLEDFDKTVTVIRCRACGYSICSRCGAWDDLKLSRCPGCGATALWEKQAMVPK